MRITTKLLGFLPLIVTSLFMSCGQVTLQGEMTSSQDSEQEEPDGGYGTLNLSLDSESFPEGAEKLVLRINSKEDTHDDCYRIEPFIDEKVKGELGSGLGLASLPYPAECYPVLDEEDPVQAPKHDIAIGRPGFRPAIKIIVKRGDPIMPIKLKAGSYHVTADFLDESSQLLYTGSEYVTIFDGEKRAVTILLRKIESGELTIGFEVEKPNVPFRLIKSDAHLELRKRDNFGVGAQTKFIDLDLERGIAVVQRICAVKKICHDEARKITLSKKSLTSILAQLSDVVLESPKAGVSCANPPEYISVVLKKCKDCEVGKTYEFDNRGCGLGTHNLASDSFDSIWQVVNTKQ